MVRSIRERKNVKMKKRLFAIFMCVCLCCALGITALADIIWVPENNFADTHTDEMETVVRYYYANGAQGYVTVSDEPDGSAQSNITNGEKLYVSLKYTSESGEEWGLVELEKGDDTITGWAKFTDMLLVYDFQSFREDHESEFEHPGDMCGLEIGKEYVLWAYPDSGILKDTVTFDEDWEFQFDDTYTDPDGRLWGYVGYYYGGRNGWICIDDPESKSIPGQEIYTGELIPASGSESASTGDSGEPASGSSSAQKVKTGGISYTVALIAGVVIIAAAVIIALVIKRRKSSDTKAK